MFVDRAIVTFIAGKGGNGCVSFRREKCVARGGPDGGDGGDGANIILIGNNQIHSLINFKYQRLVRAENGKPGSGANKKGKNGKDIIIQIPQGTVIKSFPDEKILFDFFNPEKPEQQLIITKGGKGGVGNTHFKSSSHQTPRKALPGKEGEKIKVILELKLIAFAGLVGFPNAGKSTLISKISSAKPKIADYPFTTLTPHLGVVYNNYDSLIIADIPGIIEGAHQGEGMGLSFLRHIERNELLIFLVDGAILAPPYPLDAFKILQNELKCYQPKLMFKKKMVVANKIDLINENREKLAPLKRHCQRLKIPYLEISALKEINISRFKQVLFTFYNEK